MNKTILTTLTVMALLVSCRGQQAKATGQLETKGEVQLPAANGPATAQDPAPSREKTFDIRIKNPDDSIRIVRLLEDEPSSRVDNLMLYYGRHFIDIPYVAYTLDQDKEEGLVINTEELDCTTYVENVLALATCAKRGYTSFADFCKVLAQVRYAGGEVAYTSRQHYFTYWMTCNKADGLIEDVELPQPPLSAKRKPHVDYMTTHVESYKMLNAHRQWLPEIKEMERKVNATTLNIVPKEQLRNSNRYREYIHDGDIIGIVTNKKGLDISHVGLAVWHEDGLHLMNASSIHKKVIDEPMTLYQYLQKQTSRVGICLMRMK